MSEAIVERVAKALVASRGAVIITDPKNWPAEVARYRKLCAQISDYADARSLITDAFRDARIAVTETLAALNPTPERTNDEQG